MTPAWLTAVPVAHRGLHDLAQGRPENSRAAFAAAIAEGYAIELDVRLSGDGTVMVFHDQALERLLGRPGRCDTTSAEDLGRMAILGTTETVPTLAQVLDQVAGGTPLLIEVKSAFPDDFPALCQALHTVLAGYAGPLAVQSFHPGVVEWFRANAPAIPRGQIATVAGEYKDLDPQALAAMLGLVEQDFGAPHFVAFDIRHLPDPLTDRARAAGRPVLTWTVRTAEHKARAKAHADNVIFEGCLP